MRPPADRSVVLLAIGSRGDVQPMAVLSAALRHRGVPSRVVALEDYADLVTGLGAEVVPVAGRLEAALELTHSRFARATFRSPAGQAVLLRRWLRYAGPAVADAVTAAVRSGDTVLTGVLTREVASVLARGRGCRPATMVFTGQLPTAHAESHYWAQHYTRWPAYNVRAGRFNWLVASTLGAPVAAEVGRRLGVPPLRPRAAAAYADQHPVVVAASPLVVPPAPDWPPNVHQTGYLAPSTRDPHPGRDGDSGLDDLERFLADGPPPVHVGFGSMAGTPGHDDLDDLVEAARRSRLRLLTPALEGHSPGPVSDRVLAVGDLPHEWLFARTAGVVHHGGAGTTHTALRACVPSVAVPFGVDQPYHAYRLHRLGVGPAPVRVTRLTVGRLTRLLSDLVHGPESAAYRRRAVAVGERIRAEDGVGRTVDLLHQLGLA